MAKKSKGLTGCDVTGEKTGKGRARALLKLRVINCMICARL